MRQIGAKEHFPESAYLINASQRALACTLSWCTATQFAIPVRVYERTQRIGAVSGFLAHSDPAAAYVYVAENDGKLADAAMAATFAS